LWELGEHPDRLMGARLLSHPWQVLDFLVSILPELAWKRQLPASTIDEKRTWEEEEQERSGWLSCS
jgi:hypothetical protein